MSDRIKRIVARVNDLLDRWRTTRVLRTTVGGFFAHEALQYSGAMAYFAILSLVNLFILVVVVAAFVVGQGSARDFVVSRANQGLPLGQDTISTLIDGAVAARGSVGIIGLVLLLWSALGVFGALSSGIGRVFIRAPKRPFWKDRLLGLFLLAATGILGLASVGLGILTQTLQSTVASSLTIPGEAVLLTIVAYLTPIVLIFFAFLIIYRVVPNRPITIGESWPGALVATILWSGLRIGFTYYTTEVAHYDSVFGPIGTAISLLVFLYFSSVILLLGAELVRAEVLEKETETTGTRPEEVSPVPPEPSGQHEGRSGDESAQGAAPGDHDASDEEAPGQAAGHRSETPG